MSLRHRPQYGSFGFMRLEVFGELQRRQLSLQLETTALHAGLHPSRQYIEASHVVKTYVWVGHAVRRSVLDGTEQGTDRPQKAAIM